MPERVAETRQYGTRMAVLAGWQVCPRCGSPLANDGSKVECASCGLVHYANPAPAVSAVVVDGAGNVLLARRAHDPDAGLWDTLGGFLDVGEEPEAGLRRELREEAGVEIEIGELVTMYVDRYGDDADAPPLLVLLWEATITRRRAGARRRRRRASLVSPLRPAAPDEIAFHALPSVLAQLGRERPLDAPKGRTEPALRLGEGEGEASNARERAGSFLSGYALRGKCRRAILRARFRTNRALRLRSRASARAATSAARRSPPRQARRP